MLLVLIKNELIKMIKRKKTIVVFLIFLIFILFTMYIAYKDDVTMRDRIGYNTCTSQAIEFQIENYKEKLKDCTSEDYKKQLKQDIELCQYYLDNDITPIEEWEFNCGNYFKELFDSLGIVLLVAIIAILVSDMVSGEATPPTMKFLLVQPTKRSKILFSKYVASIIWSILIIGGTEIITFIGLGVLKGFDVLKQPIIVGTKYSIQSFDCLNTCDAIIGSGHIISIGELLAKAFLFQMLFIVAACSFTVLISTLCKSSSSSMSISIMVMIFISVISLLSKRVAMSIGNYIFINYGSVSMLFDGKIIQQFSNNNFTVQNGIIVMLVTTIVCYLMARYVFCKKDILI